MAKIRRDASEKLDVDAAFLLMARCALGGPTDDGRASYQVLLHECSSCSRGEQEANGERIEVNDETIEMARCDAQLLDEQNFDPRGYDASQAGDPDDSSGRATRRRAT